MRLFLVRFFYLNVNICRKFVPKTRDVLNWFQCHDKSARGRFGETGIIDRLKSLKVSCFYHIMI